IDEQDARASVTRVIQGMRLTAAAELGAIVFERMRAEAVEDHAAQEPRGNDAVGVDVVAPHGDGGAGHDGAGGVVGHGQALLSGVMVNSSRASVTLPAMAAAATMTGDMSSVRPVGEPWRPLKLRFDDEAHTCGPSSLSGFMARHIEQPASRNSNPASRKTWS